MILAVAWGTFPAQAAEARRGPVKVSAKQTKAKQKKPTEPVKVEAPPAPLLPYQLPAQVPTVSFRNGQLGIVADNSTLAGVLEQVRAATGAAVEVTALVGQERVSVRLGPGAPREVLADLLNGSNYNYVLLGSLRDPRVLERIIVTQRGAPVSSSASTPSPVFPVRVQRPPQTQPEEEPEIVPEAEETPDESQPVPGETQPGSPQAAPQPGALPGPVTPAPGQPPQVKTPQELLQELQERMRRHQEEQDQERQQQEEPK